MSALVEPITITGDFVSVSLIVWRRFKRPMPGLVEQVFADNPGLADLGHFLPTGAMFNLAVPTPREPQILDPVQLW